MAEFDNNAMEFFKSILFEQKLKAFIGKRQQEGIKVERIRDELADYLREMKLDRVDDA